jgi:hypothetical protein
MTDDNDNNNDDYNDKPTLGNILSSDTDEYFVLEKRNKPDGPWRAFAKSISTFTTLNAYFALDTDEHFEFRIKRYRGVPLSAWRNFPCFLVPSTLPTREELEYLNKLEGDTVANTDVEVAVDETLNQMGLFKRINLFCVALWHMFSQLVLKKGSK